MLEAVQGVERVEWQNGKASQGTGGDHYCEQNLLVYSNMAGPGSASSPIEYELTRNQHMKDPHVLPPLTVRFKDPPEGLIGEAWRILLEATDGFQLLPVHVQDYRTRWESPLRLVTRQVLTARQSSPALGDAPVLDSAQFCFGWEVINFEELQ